MKGIEILNKIANGEIKIGQKLYDQYKEFIVGSHGIYFINNLQDKINIFGMIKLVDLLDKNFWLNKKDIKPLEITLKDIEERFGCKVKIKES